MATDSRTLVRRYFDELCNRRNYEIAEDLLAENVRFFGAGVLEPVRGREGFLDFLRTLYEAFPDGTFSLDDDIVEGDRAAASFTFRATHRGDYLGIPATGKRVTMKGVDLFRISAGRIEEIRVYSDTASLMIQLGVVDRPERTGR